MVIFLKFPSDYLTHLFSEWMKVKELGSLDSAMTNHRRRQSFLWELSRKVLICSGRLNWKRSAVVDATTLNTYHYWLHCRLVKINALEFDLCTANVADVINALDRNTDNLECLFLDFNPKLSDDYGLPFCGLSKLQRVFFGRMFIETVLNVLSGLSFPEKLVELELRAVDRLTLKKLSLITSISKGLQKLTLSDCDYLHNRDVSNLEFHLNLVSFHMVNCSHIDDDMINMLLAECLRLKNVQFDSVDRLTDLTLQFLSERSSLLESFSLVDYSLWCSSAAAVMLIDRCPSLTTLELYCEGDFDEILRTTALRCSKLTHLRLYDGSGTDISSSAMTYLLSKTPKSPLLELRLINSKLMNDDVIRSLTTHCPLLEVFDCRCSSFLNETLGALVNKCKMLRELHINGCTLIDDTALVGILTTGLLLNELSFPVSNISLAALDYLQANRSLETVNLVNDESGIDANWSRLGDTIDQLRATSGIKIEFGV